MGTPVYFCDFKRKIDRDEASDSPHRWVRTSILISNVPTLLLPPVCAALSQPILKIKRINSTNFLVIKLNMQSVICNFLRKIRARASRISKTPLYNQYGRIARDSLNSVNISQKHIAIYLLIHIIIKVDTRIVTCSVSVNPGWDTRIWV